MFTYEINKHPEGQYPLISIFHWFTGTQFCELTWIMNKSVLYFLICWGCKFVNKRWGWVPHIIKEYWAIAYQNDTSMHDLP